MGARSGSGYGYLSVGGRDTRAHIYAYSIVIGPVECGMFVCHRCDNKLCVRPSHLYEGTPRQNTRDAFERGLMDMQALIIGREMLRGERHHQAILTKQDVMAIRTAHLEGFTTGVDLAQAYGVSQTTISRIVKRKTWTHI
jgi:hypothetical protein